MFTAKPKNIQIERAFFFELISYAYLHVDLDDPAFQRIDAAFHRKLEAMERHSLYTTYKTGPTQESRQKAREEYLELAGVFDSCRWPAGHDLNVTRHPDADLLP